MIDMVRYRKISDPLRKYEPRVYPYWKVQFYVEKNFARRDIQKAFHDMEVALAVARDLNKKHIRLMEIRSAKERVPLPEITDDSADQANT